MADDDEKPPQTEDEYFDRGNKRRKEGDFDGAIADFDEAIRLNKNYSRAWNGRGAAWYGKGEYDKAIADYDEAIRLKPDYVEARGNRGIAWGEKGEYDKAIAYFNEVIHLNPNDEKSWYNRGNTWHHKGEYDKAIADYDEAIRLKPDYKDAIHNRALALALKATEAERKVVAERIEKEYEKRLKQELEAAVGQIVKDDTEFRKGYKENIKWAKCLRIGSIVLLVLIGCGLLWGAWVIYCIQKDSLTAWGLMPWLPVMTAISAPFVAVWWMVQRWSFELKTLAYGLHRKAIVEERMLLYFGNDLERLREMQKIYVVHWMEKSPLEVMLTIGGKKGMGGGDSPTAALLGKLAEKVGDGISKTGKDGAS